MLPSRIGESAMRRTVFLLAVVGVALGSGSALADIRLPDPPPAAPREVKVVVQVDVKAKGTVIVLPRGVAAPRPIRVPFRPAPNDPPPPEGEQGAVERPQSHTLIAGIALAMSAGMGGMWLARKNAKSLALFLAVGGVFTAGAVVWGNAPAPVRPAPVKVEGKALIDFKATLLSPAEGDAITIVLDSATLEALTNPPAKK